MCIRRVLLRRGRLKGKNLKGKVQKLNQKLKGDLKARTFVLSLNIIELCDDLPNKKAVWVITDQLLRSSTSIGANINEAKSASSRLDFKRYYEIALKSAHETVYWLSLLKMSKIYTGKSADILIAEVKEISNMLGKSVLTLKGKKMEL
jgi:four helix bundle protein